jgi:hypothetical protein
MPKTASRAPSKMSYPNVDFRRGQLRRVAHRSRFSMAQTRAGVKICA